MTPKQPAFEMPFRDAAGNIGMVASSHTTLEELIKLGIDVKLVRKDEPLGPGCYRYDYDRDYPKV